MYTANMGKSPMEMTRLWAVNNETPQYEHAQDIRHQDADGEHVPAGVWGLSVDTSAPMTLSPGLNYEETMYDSTGATLEATHMAMDGKRIHNGTYARMVRAHVPDRLSPARAHTPTLVRLRKRRLAAFCCARPCAPSGTPISRP